MNTYSYFSLWLKNLRLNCESWVSFFWKMCMWRSAYGWLWVSLCLNFGAYGLFSVGCMSAICAALLPGYAASCKTYCYVYYLVAATTSFPFMTPFLSLHSVFYCSFYWALFMSLCVFPTFFKLLFLFIFLFLDLYPLNDVLKYFCFSFSDSFPYLCTPFLFSQTAILFHSFTFWILMFTLRPQIYSLLSSTKGPWICMLDQSCMVFCLRLVLKLKRQQLARLTWAEYLPQGD